MGCKGENENNRGEGWEHLACWRLVWERLLRVNFVTLCVDLMESLIDRRIDRCPSVLLDPLY